MKIPSNNLWQQNNSGDVLGVLGSTRNMALDTLGKATLSRKATSIYTSQQNAALGYPLALVYFDNDYHVITDDTVFYGGIDGTAWTEETDFTPNTSLASDAVIFNNLLLVTEDDNLASWNGTGTDTYSLAALTAGVPHPMAVFGTQLAIGNGNLVGLYNTSYVLQITLTLPTEFQVTTIRVRNDFIYVGTRNKHGGNARIFIWDGDSTLWNYDCEVGASWVFSMTEYRNSVAAITSQGQLGIVNGTTFEMLDALPVFYNPHARWQGAGGLQLNGKVFNRGMCTIGDSIYIHIEGEVDVGFDPEMKSGLWVYDPNVGLYHRSGSSTDRNYTDGSLSRSGDTLTTALSHGLRTGDGVSFATVSGLTGVDSDITYYVEVISDTEIKLSKTRKALQAGQYVTLGGTPTGSDILVYGKNTDFGGTHATSGAIMPTVYNETPQSHLAAEVLWGCRMNLPDGTANYCINTFTDAYNVGSITTQRIYSDNIDDTWQNIYNFIDGLALDEEEVVVKVQTEFEADTQELGAVWLDSSTLNSENPEDFSAWTDVEEGDELVFVDGSGRGRTAHVVTKTTGATTVSLLLDEDFGTANESCTVYRTTFKRIGSYTKDNKDKEKLKTALDGVVSPWIAIKVEMRGFQPALNTMELSHLIHKK